MVYEIKPDWGFVSKQLVYSKGGEFRINSVNMLGSDLGNAIAGEHG